MPDRMPEDLPDRMPEDMPEDMPDHMPEDMPDRMSNRMSEDMSDRMSEDLPVRKCINVMVGITRSKVFFFVFLILVEDPSVATPDNSILTVYLASILAFLCFSPELKLAMSSQPLGVAPVRIRS